MLRKGGPHKSRELDEAHLKYSRTGLPFVTVKLAETLDGRIATTTGDSQWISSSPSLRLAHRLRREHDAVMVGAGTVLADDPELTVRLVRGRSPLRVVIDGRLRIPLTARMLHGEGASQTLIAATEAADPGRVRELCDLGADVMIFPADRSETTGNAKPGSERVDLTELLAALGRRRIASVLVEGGSGIVTSLLAARCVDRLVMIIAPKIIGGGLDAIGDLGIRKLQDAITFSSVKVRRLGPDILFDGRIEKGEVASSLVASSK
jgi:diaminohydroxyphosphoribosylaminopyrimidine deaminase/5-amino-6-(5-phosphoribosylamino)uracil reductase